jgi:hypothetical protein
MAPEAAGNVVVLDLYADPESDRKDAPPIRSRVTCYQPTERSEATFIDASWNADAAGEGWVPVADGVVYVRPPADYEHTAYDAAVPRAAGRYFWRHPVHGSGLMLVAVLPTGYVVARTGDSEPTPADVKPFQGRMALYWWIGGPLRGEARWALTRIEPDEIDARCESLLDQIVAPPPPRPQTREI